MKKIIFSAAVLMLSAVAFAQQPSEQEIEKAWMEHMTPGDVHKKLAMDDGTWNEEMTMWTHPGAEPMKNTMTCTSRMILGGRYQETRHTGSFMGMPFEGISLVGYDNASKKMVSTWMDNMATGIMYMQAPYDGKSKSMEFKGRTTDPVTKKEKNVREVFTMIDANTRKIEMYDTAPDGKEYKSMEIIMTRKI